MSTPDAEQQQRRMSFLPNLQHLPNPMARKDRRKSMHFNPTNQPRSRWMLHLQATMWRILMGIGMLLHKIAPPRPPKPNFTENIPATVSGKPGMIPLNFYVPRDWETQKRLWERQPQSKFRDEILEEDEEEDGAPSKSKNRRVSTALSDFGQNFRRKSFTARRWGGYPVVINFHGGGFTIGTATDDARWCGTVVDECNAVVITVDYRRAPENPFPIAVEDGVDAVLWVHDHADSLGIDREKIALSGFSSGGNMAFTVPLRLYQQQTDFEDDGQAEQAIVDEVAENARQAAPPENMDSASSSSTAVPPNSDHIVEITPDMPPPKIPEQQSKTRTAVTATAKRTPEVRIRCIVPWYPSVDYTRTREERRAGQMRKDHELPAIFTDLFDESYLHPPKSVNLDSPYLSPGVAPTSLLQHALPQEIIMTTCESDMLLDEGEAFRDRLRAPPLSKNVVYTMVEGVAHGWDKAPNPLKPTPGVREHYLRVCKELRRVLGAAPGQKEHATNAGPSAAPRESVQVVN
ncbi:hypothetical protein LTR62_004171 [Meristemomyces frigidus]|uniref:Alpha/beta hydrolase fold-3 domain-containing protein n=1 Tax=Meristemomyces frigidus TaxID=1508187 RepID=A0AAN7TQC5_9PEZI|nr:hypothetical protein LTR62_004171 [Meristemomyces frigidus]